MALRVRYGSAETVLRDEAELAALYRRRVIAPGDLVWHPVRGCWIRVEAFLFIDTPAAAWAAAAASTPSSAGEPPLPAREGFRAAPAANGPVARPAGGSRPRAARPGPGGPLGDSRIG